MWAFAAIWIGGSGLGYGLGRLAPLLSVTRPVLPPAWTIGLALAVGTGLLAVYSHLGWTDEGLHLGILLVLLLVAAAIDAVARIIPNRLLLAGALIGLVWRLAFAPATAPMALLAGLCLGGLLWALRGISQRYFGRPGFGMGDVKYVAVLALYLGWSVAWVVYLAAVLGGLVGLMAWGLRRIDRTTQIPFAPLLAIGAFLHLTWLPVGLVWL